METGGVVGEPKSEFIAMSSTGRIIGGEGGIRTAEMTSQCLYGEERGGHHPLTAASPNGATLPFTTSKLIRVPLMVQFIITSIIMVIA